MINIKAPLLGALGPMLMMTACGGGSATPTSSSTTMPPSTVKSSVGEKLAALVANGQLPALDHSSTLTGPDADGNGIRDDIDAWIASQQVSAPQRAALVQHAKVMQAILGLDSKNTASVDSSEHSMSRSINCIHDNFDVMIASGHVFRIEQMTMNTKLRFKAYAAFNSALNGKVFSDAEGNVCD